MTPNTLAEALAEIVEKVQAAFADPDDTAALLYAESDAAVFLRDHGDALLALAARREDAWEYFCDEGYFHMWRVRRIGERGFGDGFSLRTQEEARDLCALLNAATPSQPASEAREGWVLVPCEPTFEMWNAAEDAMICADIDYQHKDAKIQKEAHSFPTMRIWQAVVGYRAMLAASPTPPTGTSEQEGGHG